MLNGLNMNMLSNRTSLLKILLNNTGSSKETKKLNTNGYCLWINNTIKG